MSENKGASVIGAALVVGGGVGGVQAALDLADAGYYVYLVERSPSIGGVMAQLDKTFPTMDCSLCILSPKLVECGRHLNIEILTNAEVQRIEGKPGNFRVTVVQQPRYVDIEKCVGCGLCAEKCPAKAPDEYNQGLSQRKAIFINYPQAVPLAYTVDKENCIFLTKGYTKEGKPRCQVCLKACAREAIDFEQTEQERTLEVGAVILAPGFDEFEPRLKGEYGYGRYPNVVSSIEFERILNASGPYRGEILRPSDLEHPHRIAFIQCVGSRDPSVGNPYCSSVCCMYAIKEALVAKEHAPDLDITIFFMDMRAQGKGFDTFYQRARDEFGVKFIRSRISGVEELRESRNLLLRWETEQGELKKEEFDLVVLSVGLTPVKGVGELAERLGLGLNDLHFCGSDEFAPIETNRPGIFICGVFQGPKDIPETVAQASGAMAKAAAIMAPARGTMTRKKEYPPEIDVRGQEPRIGAFICHCGINIGGVVNVSEVVEYAATLPNVVFADQNLYSCSQDTQERIKQMIKEHSLNRVVVAACTPRTHEPLFRETLREGGLNPNLFEMANIRDHCSWVHMHEPEEATRKAKDLVRMAVAKVRLLQPLEEMTVDVVPKGLVVGGGLAGMTAALELAHQGFECYLVEREKELGGNLRQLYYTLENDDVQGFLQQTIQRVMDHKLIHVYTGAQIKEVSGYVGNFKTIIEHDGQPEELEHGVVIVATGGREYIPHEYSYEKDSRIITQRELEQRIVTSPSEIGDCKTVVMIQCVGSRTEVRPYCSKICCSQAVKNALKIKELNPEANIFILYKDVRTYGFRELFYTQARSEGVLFVRYHDEDRPEVIVEDGRLQVTVFDPIVGERLAIDPDLVVLSVAILPNENEELAKMLKVPRTEEGFFLEAHVKLRPVDFATDGVYLCGLAHFPKPLDESIFQAAAAAGRAAIPLSRGCVSVEPVVSQVDQEKCFGCGICEYLCPFNAIRLMPTPQGERAETITASCKGCGVCASRCPRQAIAMHHFTDEEILNQVMAFGVE